MNYLLIPAVRLKAFLLLDRAPHPDVRIINVQRILILACVMAPVHLVHVLLFAFIGYSGEGAEPVIHQQWRLGIMLSHGVMLALSLTLAMASYQLRRTGAENTSTGRSLPPLAGMLYLLFGAVLCVVDQLVTASINPYLIACVAVGLTIILRPHHALMLFLVAYILLYPLLEITQSTPEILLSMRVNGISATALGFGLSVVTWRHNMINLLQRSLIAAQSDLMEERNKQLRYLAGTDTLTSMNNRMVFMEVINQELARIRRGGPEGALLLMDIDHFKSVNDRFGHPGGDKALMRIAEVIGDTLRQSDTAARFGGEEFAILLPETSLDGAMSVAEKLRQAIQEISFDKELAGLRLTASLGVTLLRHVGKDGFDITYRLADQALYSAKRQGRNRVVASAEAW